MLWQNHVTINLRKETRIFLIGQSLLLIFLKQIELLFKLYKSYFEIESLKGKSNSSKVLCELYAKLCAIVMFHTAISCLGSKIPYEVSIIKAFLEFKRRIRELILTLKKSVNRVNFFFRNLLVAWSKFCLKDKYKKAKISTLASLKLIPNLLT